MSTRRFWAISVADLSLVDWYRDALGLTSVGHIDRAADGSRVVVVGNDDVLIEFKQRNSRSDRKAGADGYFKVGWFVSSLNSTQALLTSKGAQLVAPPVDQPEFGIRFCIVEDPEGNLIQLFEHIHT